MEVLRITAAMAVACAQLGAADWLTDGDDVQRTAWQRDEKILTTANAKDIKLLWKIKLDNEPRQMHALFPPLIVGQRRTQPSGPKADRASKPASRTTFTPSTSTRAKIIWKKHLRAPDSADTGGQPGGGILCPGGITATPVIGPADTPGKYTIYAASWDGMLHQINVADGEDIAPPAKFMPPNGKPYALNLFNNVIYTHTAQGCGGNPNMVYTYDLATKKVGTWGPAGGGMWGRTGPAISANGTMYTGTGDGRWDPENGVYGNGIVGVKQDPKTKALDLEDYYGPSNAEWLVQARSRHAGDARRSSITRARS